MKILKNIGVRYLLIEISLFLSSSIGLFLSQFIIKSSGQTNRLIAVISGTLFWIGLILAIIFSLYLNKITINKNNDNKIALIKFFSNKPAIVFDVLLIVSFIAFVICMIVNRMSNIAIIIFCIFIFSLEMHCVFNGKNYKYIISKLEEKKDGKV